MKVLICWSYISGYMAACWRALVESGACELHVLARGTGGSREHSSFKNSIMEGIPCTLTPPDHEVTEDDVRAVVAKERPDIVVINGWHTPAYRRIPFMHEASRAKFIMAMDTPYLGTMRQHLGRFAMREFFSRMHLVFVTGERCWQLAKVLGFPEGIVRRGVYGVDFLALSPLHERRSRQPGGWPRKFISTGRYVEEKAIDILVSGYKLYRDAVTDPWPLTCCGKGPLAHLLKSTPGIEDRGFVQPAQLADVLVEHGAFVLASRFDPWPLVIVEACAAGLPIVCSEACGSKVELVRQCYNGRTFATDEPASLCDALIWMHRHADELETMGRGSRELAAPYSADMWVRRWVDAFHELVPQSAVAVA
jgi:glycosyltransferase involved in cell wall biosynthesis